MSKLWSEKQREKGVKLILNWWAGRNYWRKKIDGHTKYFQHPNSAEGYSAAVAEYHAFLQSRQPRKPRQDEYELHLDLLGRFLEWYSRFGTPEDEDDLEEEIQQLHGRLKAEFESADEPRPIGHLVADGTDEAKKQLIIDLTSHSRIAGADRQSVLTSTRAIWCSELGTARKVEGTPSPT